MASKAGVDCKAYYLSTGSRATWGTTTAGVTVGTAPANLTEMTTIRDVTITTAQAQGDVSRRGSGWKLSVGGLIDATVELRLPWDPGQTDFDKLRDFWAGKTTCAIALLDGDKATSGVQGFWADFKVVDFDREEPLDGAVSVKATLKPYATSVAPEWVKVT